jgi:hypothetical protein
VAAPSDAAQLALEVFVYEVCKFGWVQPVAAHDSEQMVETVHLRSDPKNLSVIQVLQGLLPGQILLTGLY